MKYESKRIKAIKFERANMTKIQNHFGSYNAKVKFCIERSPCGKATCIINGVTVEEHDYIIVQEHHKDGTFATMKPRIFEALFTPIHDDFKVIVTDKDANVIVAVDLQVDEHFKHKDYNLYFDKNPSFVEIENQGVCYHGKK